MVRATGMRIRMIGMIVATLCLSGPTYASDSMPVPPMASAERGEYHARNASTGDELWQSTWALEKTASHGHTQIQVREDGKGRRDSDVPTAWTVEMTMDLSDQAARLAIAREVRDAAGRLIEVQQRELDYMSGSGRVTTTDERTGKSQSRSFPLTTKSIGIEMLATELRLLPDLKDQLMHFDLVTRDGKIYRMEAKIVGQEQVTVPAGRFDCFKVEMAPTGLLGVLAKLVLPKMYMWHTVAAPHFWVKFQGNEGRLGSPEIIRELVRFTPLPGIGD